MRNPIMEPEETYSLINQLITANRTTRYSLLVPKTQDTNEVKPAGQWSL